MRRNTVPQRQSVDSRFDLWQSFGYRLSLASHTTVDLRRLLSELTTYCARLDQGRKTNLESLIAFLWSWLLVHIDTADRDLADWLKAREFSATWSAKVGDQ